jgi:hypothetical protein
MRNWKAWGAFVAGGLFACFAAGQARAQSPRVLYTWKGTGDAQKWDRGFGDNLFTFENVIEGELTVTETGPEGAAGSIHDDFNLIVEGSADQGGLDLTGLSALEFDLGHNGDGPVNVQFYVQAGTGFTFVALGPDQEVSPDASTYTAPLADLTPDQLVYLRAIGIAFREHPDQGNLVWTLREVRSTGTPLAERYFATHEPGDSDNGLQGAVVNFENAAVDGNDGFQNQSGLSQNLAEPPPGNTGSLHWLDLAGKNGAAITWHNGTVFNGNTFNERPTDLSNYQKVIVRMAATNVSEVGDQGVGVQYFLQTGGFAHFTQAGTLLNLPADGEFHELEFPLSSVPQLAMVDAHGLNLQNHSADLMIDVDYLRAVGSESFADCNRNRVPDERDLVEGTSRDCNRNALPDECGIAAGFSQDCNANGVPDECDIAGPEAERVLYTWAGTGDLRSWFKAFGANEVFLDNPSDGQLTATEIGTEGTAWALSDSFGSVAEDSASFGGLDLTGMSTLEFDFGHSGVGPVNVQFYVQATPDFQYVALGPDQPVAPGISTYTAPLSGLNPAQAAYLRAVGISIRDHLAEGNLTWTLEEVRVRGTALTRRDFATHEAGSSDKGLQGALAAFDLAAFQGNDGNPNQTGLRQNAGGSPPGNTGSLQWTDLAGQGGGAVAWYNGTAWRGDNFNERPADMSPYQAITVRMAATAVPPGSVDSVDVQYFLDTNGFNRNLAGPAQPLPADGRFHELVFPIGDLPGLAYVDAHGIDLADHPDGDLIIDVDNIRAFATRATPSDCNANQVPDACDIRSGVLADLNRNGIPDACEASIFRRGDSNADGLVDLSDAVHLFAFLFLGGPLTTCPDGADSNDDGNDDISDGVYTLSHLFLGGPAPPPPGAETCGPDPTGDGLDPCGYPADACR